MIAIFVFYFLNEWSKCPESFCVKIKSARNQLQNSPNCINRIATLICCLVNGIKLSINSESCTTRIIPDTYRFTTTVIGYLTVSQSLIGSEFWGGGTSLLPGRYVREIWKAASKNSRQRWRPVKKVEGMANWSEVWTEDGLPNSKKVQWVSFWHLFWCQFVLVVTPPSSCWRCFILLAYISIKVSNTPIIHVAGCLSILDILLFFCPHIDHFLVYSESKWGFS